MTELDLLVRAAQAAVTESKARSGSAITIRPATVTGVDSQGIMAEVALDGDDESTPVGAQITYPTGLIPGDRVLIMFVEPSGAFVIGRRGGDFDEWHGIGIDGPNPFDTFLPGWQNAASTSWSPGASYPIVSYRRHGRIVELRGRAERVSGSDPDVFTLPPEYRPANILGVVGLNFLGGAAAVQVHIDGTVSAIGTSNVIFDGIMYSVNQIVED